MGITVGGIFHNLDESEYAITNNVVALFFSSEFYRSKFMGEYYLNRIGFRRKLQKAMYLEDMNTDFLADVHLYREIEKRGFRCVDIVEGRELSWQESLQFALERKIGWNETGWSKTHVKKLDTQKTSIISS